MVNIHPSASGTTARWNRKLAFFLLLVFWLPTFAAMAQGEGDPLSKKERRQFNELFFEAEKQKNIGNEEKARKLYLDLYKITTSNATVSYELARLFAADGEGDDAVFYAEKAVGLDPENKWYQFLLASVYSNFGKEEKQIGVLQKLVALDSLNPDYRYELAMAYESNRQPKKAIAELNQLEAIIGMNDLVSDKKREIYLNEGNLEAAVDEIEKLIKAFPKNVDYYGTLAQLYMVNGMEEKGKEVYERMLKIDPEDPRIHLDLAQYYKASNDFEKSIYHLKKAVTSPGLEIDKKVPILLSLFEASEGDSILRKEAYEMLNSVVEQNPNDPKAFALYGDFLSRDGKDLEALKAYRKAVSLEGGNLFQIWEQILLIEVQGEMYDSLRKDGPAAVELFPNQPLPYFFAGVAYNVDMQHSEAIGYLEDGLTYVLGSPRLKEQFYTQLADAYHQLGENEKSDSYFDRALALNSENPTVLNNYAYYLAVRDERLDKALEMTEKSNRLAPGTATFLDTWAWVLYKNGEYSLALEKIEKVVEMGGAESGEVLEHYGDILYKNGMAKEALEQWKKALETGEALPNIQEKINSGKVLE